MWAPLSTRARALALILALSGASPADAGWSYSVDFSGRSPPTHSFEDGVVSTIGVALELWTRHLAGSAAIEFEVELTDTVVRAAGHSITSGFVRSERGHQVYEQGLAYEIRTGIDPNGAGPDVRLLLNGEYAENELWFDGPGPGLAGAVPAARTDAVSVIAHELGHAFAFNGWWDEPVGRWPLPYGSPWDLNTQYDGSRLYFNGARAMALYGGPVPVTAGNNWHVGNAAGPGADLRADLMNGVVFERGARYGVSPIDLAMLADMGVALAPVPEPHSGLLLAAGLLGLVAFRWARGGIRRRAGS